MQVDREGNFKAKVIDHGVGQTKESGLPQLMLSLDFTESYDGETWEDIKDWDMHATAYLVLVGKDGRDLFNCDDVKEVFGWDGQSFAALDSMDAIDGTIIQVRIKENEYKGKTSFQVDGIKAEDATPGGGIKKLDAGALKSLDSKFGRKAKPKVAKAPKAKAKAPSKSKAPAKTKAPKAKPKPAIGESCTKDNAWDYLADKEMWRDNLDAPDDKREISEAVVMDLWSTAIEEIGPDEDKFTDEDWFIIREKIAKLIFVF